MDFLASHVGGGDESCQGRKTGLIGGVQQIRAAAALVYEFELEVASPTADINAVQAAGEFQLVRRICPFCRLLSSIISTLSSYF